MSFDGCDWWSYLEWDAIVWSPPTPHILCEIEVEQAHLPFRNICKIPYSPQVQRFMTGKQSMYVQCLAGCILYMEHLSLNVWHHAYKVLRRLKLVVSLFAVAVNMSFNKALFTQESKNIVRIVTPPPPEHTCRGDNTPIIQTGLNTICWWWI